MIVKIGKIKIGGHYPVAVQSMTNTDTNDIERSVEQCIRIADAGAHMVRLTVQGITEVNSLSGIRRMLFEKGYNFPLIADVHFNPKVAEEAAKIVEKVRINPGNYCERNLRKKAVFSEEEYQEGMETIRDKITPLLQICKERKTAIRIGVNHGSLSDRIMSRYGDTPEGMAESAMEFIRICHREGFRNLVISMKSSNTRIMVYACRILMQKMTEENSLFPIHLGVTEAGAGVEGRVRSSVGIASLLQQGIGDTIRVSLTEDPEDEIPVATEISNYFGKKSGKQHVETSKKTLITTYQKRKTHTVLNIGGNNAPVVIVDHLQHPAIQNKNNILRKPDFIYVRHPANFSTIPEGQAVLVDVSANFSIPDLKNIFFIGDLKDYYGLNSPASRPFFLLIPPGSLSREYIKLLKSNPQIIIVAESATTPDPTVLTSLFQELDKVKIKSPVIIKKIFNLSNPEKLLIRASGEAGLFFLDGLGDGLWLTNEVQGMDLSDLSFEILQASRVRSTTTEYISCPTCGRTQFDIKTLLQKVKKHTSHLTSLKIAVMGCIVNGPGEMADADYGYVGSGHGKISLYRGKSAVLKNIPEVDAIEQLIQLIKEDGKWTDP